MLGKCVKALANAPEGILRTISDLIEKLLGRDGDSWLAEFKRFLRKESCWTSKVISIDRTLPFDPSFVGNGWSIVEQDERALALTEINLTEVAFETTLKQGEKKVVGEEKLRRLKEDGRIRLDAGVFKTLWENQHLIPEKWKAQTNGNTTFIFFDGTVLQNSNGNRCVLCLYGRGGGWDWDYRWLDRDWGANNPSAVLASSTVALDASAS